VTELEFKRSGCENPCEYCLRVDGCERWRAHEMPQDLYCAATMKRQVRCRLGCHAVGRCFTSHICNVVSFPMCHLISPSIPASIRAPEL
jgi:hypothetical protein